MASMLIKLSLQLCTVATIVCAAVAQTGVTGASGAFFVTANRTAATARSAADPNAGYFTLSGTSTVPGIHTVLTFKKTVIITDRADVNNGKAKLSNGQPAYAEEYAYGANYFRPLNVITNTFCSTGQLGDDGTLYSIGGSTNVPAVQPLLQGADSVRRFTPCDGGAGATCDFAIAGRLTSQRWYPTSQILPDGRILVIGGCDAPGGIAINNIGVNQPTFEFWPGGEKQTVAMLQNTENVPYNLYPFVHLLPSGHLFVFAGQLSVVLDYGSNKVVRDLPRMQAPGEPNVYRSYPVTGTSALHALDPAKGYEATVLICGGGDKNANSLTVNGNNCPGCYLPATASCGLIQPDSNNPQWTWEYMPDKRVMPDAVLLLDDTILILNGAGVGFQGTMQNFASQPVTKPCLYDTRKPVGKRFSGINADSGIPRVYHSSALLMPDGTVLVSGSNPNAGLAEWGPFPTEFRIQTFHPPYTTWGVQRNVLTNVPTDIAMNAAFLVTLSTTIPTPAGMAAAQRFRVVLANPGFSTHSQRHGMRNIFLTITATQVAGGTASTRRANASSASSAQRNTAFGTAVVRGGSDLAAVRKGPAAAVKRAPAAKTKTRPGAAKGPTVAPKKVPGGKQAAQPAAGTLTVTLSVQAPPNGNIAPAGMYWLHVLDQGGAGEGFWVPTVEGAAVRLHR